MNIDYNFTKEEYEKLYKRFISDERTECLVKAADCKDKIVLDICAGGGRLTQKALDCGAKSVVAIDIDPHVEKLSNADKHILGLNISVEDMATMPIFRPELYSVFAQERIQVMYCQQAINYWLNFYTLARLVKAFGTKDLQFCFNTFNTKPSYKPQSKSYTIDGVNYVETWQLVRYALIDHVYHIQACEWMEPHLTKFRWIDMEVYINTLKLIFNEVNEIVDGGSTIWVAKGVKDVILYPE